MESGEGEENKETFFKGMYLESQYVLWFSCFSRYIDGHCLFDLVFVISFWWSPLIPLWYILHNNILYVSLWFVLTVYIFLDRQKLADLEQELQSARFDKVALSDRILQLQRKLRQAEVTRDASNSEAIRLRVKLEEMAIKKGEKMGEFGTVKLFKLESSSAWLM